MIPYGRQDITPADIDAVVAVLESDFLTQGPQVPLFEQTVADYTGAAHAVATNSATSALHLACRALGVGPGDIVWTTPITFVASANCARYCGAAVDFVDIDPETFNLSATELEAKLKRAEITGGMPKVVVAVHLCGQPCDLRAIHALSKRYGFAVIEDASHAIGARYEGRPVGDGRYSDITVFSFHPVKIVTSAEGGMAVTQNEQLAEAMRLLRSHGVTRDEARMSRPGEGGWYYEQIDLGYNYRMTELQAALGISQMQRLNDYLEQRHAVAHRYDKGLSTLALCTPARAENSYSALHLYVIRIPDGAVRRRTVFDGLRAADIGVNVHYIPVHLQPYYRDLGFREGDFPHAENYYAQAISLPMFPTLTHTDQNRVIDTLHTLLA
ncbi:UDP-4-amino-4,6-dideoxy-N-acetyl-beta-L-altrosamine transaminase [Endozoicomonas sp. G2_2]|uniref:UDP-4-amino-4, 6-dideoxy-N-acetyl-beta-L-altrosamine transaminase n=1 Tax=Endozoicomonas sp. G2_2 TaxID=2821092 RepID=UPI001ADC7E19|nr:UDP-4-amino-4,6-dideoxy-N-acetyl-beta-L-altrosamine transaminase [Endozoicomonas sp. G2_2]MBO9469661.1 UDP-4-amino-4,6-dideoxy-N-acetyl-beta-L-altrosamine transaminase [Endozoicomonas sp. G2_2]